MNTYTLTFDVNSNYQLSIPQLTIVYHIEGLRSYSIDSDKTITFEAFADDILGTEYLKFSFDGTSGFLGDEIILSNIYIDGQAVNIKSFTTDNGAEIINGEIVLQRGEYTLLDVADIINNPDDPVDDPTGEGVIVGTDGDDKSKGTKDDDIINSGEGDDRVHGHDGDDVIYGGAGNDELFGGSGDDILYGGEGLDILNGGNGADTFVFRQSDNITDDTIDVIKGFSVKDSDKIDISDLLDDISGDINDYFNFVKDKGSIFVQINVDGAANGANFQSVVEVVGVNDLDINSLII